MEYSSLKKTIIEFIDKKEWIISCNITDFSDGINLLE